MITLEICVDDPDGMLAAVQGGADRIELCAALALGGLTPSAGLMQIAKQLALPAMAMIRPRAGDFVWSETEIAAQISEIAAVRNCGLAGVVIGASRTDGQLDAETLARLVAAAQGLDVTLHRAIDLAPDPVAAMRICADLGIKRVLSSGGATSALDGIARLAAMQAAARDVTVMPGGGVSAGTLATLARDLHLTEVHASCSVPAPPPADPKVAAFGFLPANAQKTDVSHIKALRAALDQLAGAGTRGWTSS